MAKFSLSRLTTICKKLHKRGVSIVFTNGCFDILHYGHVKLLREARALGDVLVVGINSDKSLERLKARKPFNNLKSRIAVLSEFKSVDYIVAFRELTPIKVIQSLLPNVLVKGGDYKSSEVVGAEEVRKRNGKVVILPFYKGYSTTSVLKRIRKENA
tara:strand:+ start:119 stop:589 length:471 start_codon:yes stop_codon:yes gene_type:complete